MVSPSVEKKPPTSHRAEFSGPGLPEQVLPHVFDRFYKADTARTRTPGSGLGLAIALENARLHGGDLTAGGSDGGGARFVLRLPRNLEDR